MEALSATESMLQGKLSKAVKVRHPHLSLLHSSSNLMHPPQKFLFFAIIDPVRFLFFAIIHNKAAYSFTSLSPLPSVVWPQVFNWLCVELLIYTTPFGKLLLTLQILLSVADIFSLYRRFLFPAQSSG